VGFEAEHVNSIDVKYVDPKNKKRKNAFFMKTIKYVKNLK